MGSDFGVVAGRSSLRYPWMSRWLTELKRVRALQEKVVMRMLDGSVEGNERPKGPRLTIVK